LNDSNAHVSSGRPHELLPQHEKYLVARGIDPAAALAEGWRSVVEPKELARLGFGRSQRLVPSLAVPVRGVDGEIRFWRHRPDVPRIDARRGRAVKFEQPCGVKLAVYCPLTSRAKLRDVATPLFVLEKESAAVCLGSRGLCVLALLGCWSWRDASGTLADFESVALRGRLLYVGLDGDGWTNPDVGEALRRFSGWLKSRGADVRILRVPHDGEGRPRGIEDFVGAGGKIEELLGSATTEAPPAPPAKKAEAPQAPPLSAPERQAVEALKRDPRLLDRLAELVHRAGVIGEDCTIRLLILAFVARLGDAGLAVYLLAEAASGKSMVVRRVLDLFPKETVLALSSLSANALYYRAGGLDHVIVFLAELRLDDSDEAKVVDQQLREAVSEGYLRKLTTEKLDGRLEAGERGPSTVGMIYVATSTRRALNIENASRALVLSTDASAQQTRRVLDSLGRLAADPIDRAALEGELRLARAFHAELKSYPVLIPFGPALAAAFPGEAARERRDLPKLFLLIRAHALLHQEQRERRVVRGAEHIVATPTDYLAVRAIAAPVLKANLADISPVAAEVLAVVAVRFTAGVEFSGRELYGCLQEAHVGGVSRRSLKDILRELSSAGPIEWNGERGKASAYRYVADPATLELPDLAEDLPPPSPAPEPPPAPPPPDDAGPWHCATCHPPAVEDLARLEEKRIEEGCSLCGDRARWRLAASNGRAAEDPAPVPFRVWHGELLERLGPDWREGLHDGRTMIAKEVSA